MKPVSNKALVVVSAVLIGGLAGALSLWLPSDDDTRQLNRLKEHAICVVDLPEGTSTTSARFTITRPVETFHIGAQTRGNGGRYDLSILGDHGLVGSISFTKIAPFSLGREIRPGTYNVTLRQEINGQGALVVISGERPVYLTGWQIWSRTYVSLLIVAGVCVPLSNRIGRAKSRSLALAAFHSLLLGFALGVIYLLFHEGGHALAEMAFGRFDFAKSDFLGVNGHPHSAGVQGPPARAMAAGPFDVCRPDVAHLCWIRALCALGSPTRAKAAKAAPNDKRVLVCRNRDIGGP